MDWKVWSEKPESGMARKVWEVAEEVFQNASVDELAKYDNVWDLTIVGTITFSQLKLFLEKLGIDDVEVNAWEDEKKVGVEISWEEE